MPTLLIECGMSSWKIPTFRWALHQFRTSNVGSHQHAIYKVRFLYVPLLFKLTKYDCRLLGPLFADGMSAPRISVTGNNLPFSRIVSRTMHPDEGFHDHAGTVMVIAWGQFMDHDFTLTGTPLGELL